MSEFQVRRANEADLPVIVALEEAIFPSPWSEESLRFELIDDGRHMPFVAHHGFEPLGFAFAWRVADEIHLVNLGVLSGHRRRGIGQRLLDAVLTDPRAAGARLCTLEVRAGNEEAKAFYERNGFRAIALRPRYYEDSGEDAVIMLKSMTALGEASSDP